MIHKSLLVLLTTLAIAMPVPVMAAEDALRLVSIDVDGGASNLFITPHGKSILVDTGNPDRGEHPNSETLEKAIKGAGVTKLDYLILTHYHVDHIGGMEGLLKRIPVDTFIDHGVNREVPGTQGPGGMIGPDWRTVGPDGKPRAGRDGQVPPAPTEIPPPNSTAGYYARYLQLIAGHPHRVVKPGEKLEVDGVTFTFVAVDGVMIANPLPGAGEKNPDCASMPGMESNGGEENTRSTSMVISYGKAKVALFGDLTWDREKDLFCPIDKVGKVDLYIVSHHGTQWSGSPAMLNSLQPIVALMGDGLNKGDDPERVKTIEASPRLKGLWRLHAGRGKESIDGDPNMIANNSLDLAEDTRASLKVNIRSNGEITVTNERNGFSKTYIAGK
jgi:glyoxylase-like metal-dependent hydrolase (beta-lactamase superfamily II)